MIWTFIIFFLPIHPIASSYIQTPLVQPHMQSIWPCPLRVRECSSKGTAELGLHTSLRLQDDQQYICLLTVTCTKQGHSLTVRLHLRSWKLKEKLTFKQNQPVYIKNRPSKYYFSHLLLQQTCLSGHTVTSEYKQEKSRSKLAFFLLLL